MAGPKPSKALSRRHAAAMKIIWELPAEERGAKLLALVLVGSEAIDAAVRAAELEDRPAIGRQRRVAA